MTLEQLRIFVAVAQREHVTQAARALNLTQSAVSDSIAALETRHGVRLFDRVGRTILLNETGRAFLAEAQGVLARAAAAEGLLADLATMRRGRLLIQAAPTIANYWLPPFLVRFHHEFPAVHLEVAMSSTAGVIHAVRVGEAELGFIEGRVEDPLLHHQIVAHDQLVIVVAPDHPWAGGMPLRPEDFATSPWIVREAGSGTRTSFENALTAARVPLGTLDLAMTLPSDEAVLAAVMEGAGATALSESAVALLLSSGQLRAVHFPLPARSYRMLRHKERHFSQSAQALMRLMG